LTTSPLNPLSIVGDGKLEWGEVIKIKIIKSNKQETIMKNPNGPYPGRQVFVGVTEKGKPAFAYLVTGRSPQSRERKATPKENSIINGPIGNQPYHWLFHYTAVKYDNEIGLGVATNGIQTEALFETYKLIYHTASTPNKSYLKKIMEGANFEPDSLKTPRVSAIITNPAGKKDPVYHLSIVTHEQTTAWQLKPEPGTLRSVSTYHGDIDNPGAYKIENGPTELKFAAETADELANFIYDISAVNYKGDDIRVFAIGGIREGNAWKIAHINRHKG
jgi:IMP cyclohydrolase